MQASFGTWALLCLIGSVPLAAQTSYREELSLGGKAYKQARYEDAIRHFRNATDLDPQQEQGHFYLATAYAQEYVPGVDAPDNVQRAESAIREFEKVLAVNPQSKDSLKSIAFLYLNMKKLEDAKSFYRKVVDLDANDPETYYSIGVIDWTETYTRSMRLREKLKKQPDQAIIEAAECWDLRDANQATVKEGIEMMVRAMELRPNYDDAMAYVNLLYRQKADIDCSDAGAYDSDLQSAQDWADQSLNARKAKAEKFDQQRRESRDGNSPAQH